MAPKGEGNLITQKQLRQMTAGILRDLKIGREVWDVLLVGDGSGTTSTNSGGWACLAVERGRPLRAQTFYGGTNHGSNIRCELLAYVFPLMHYAENAGDGLRIHVITDCKYIKQAGEKKIEKKKHKPLWTAVETCKRAGITINWHWIPRDTHGLNKMAHIVANRSRLAMKGLQTYAVSEKEVKRRARQRQ